MGIKRECYRKQRSYFFKAGISLKKQVVSSWETVDGIQESEFRSQDSGLRSEGFKRQETPGTRARAMLNHGLRGAFSILAADRRLPTADCRLPTAYCLLPTAYCLLPTAYCLMLTGMRFGAVHSGLRALSRPVYRRTSGDPNLPGDRPRARCGQRSARWEGSLRRGAGPVPGRKPPGWSTSPP